MNFPTSRPRRLRLTGALRDLVAQVRLHPSDFIAPFFVAEALEAPRPIRTLPNISQHTPASLVSEVEKLQSLGVKSVMVFGVPSEKDPRGSKAYDPDGICQVALRALRDRFGDEMVIMSDLCLDEYTDHGHCGVLDRHGRVLNDATCELYGDIAVAQARAGAHMVAPSGMMDGQVGVIRRRLDDEGFTDVGILAYSVKYASGLYGPFREAVDVVIADGGDRRGYQQDFRNVQEAQREVLLDIAEGADMVMVKPALTYLDIIQTLRGLATVPVAAYQVSGEYAMIKFADAAGAIDGEAVAFEQMTAIKRAGADVILTYFARELAEKLQDL